MTTRGKLDAVITTRVDDELRDALDREQRKRESETGHALTRAVLVRHLVEERLGLKPVPGEA